MSKIPNDIKKIIEDIIAYEEMMKEQIEDESGLEYLYDYVYDYSEYPEKDDYVEYDEWSTVIKIDL